jgi:methylenetetrahydrofolate dehydrogenase (NADP+)/methenyltetrahydrofolate cyclohydrolase
MSASELVSKTLDGKAIAQKIKTRIATAIQAANQTTPASQAPGLAVILVGENPASEIYIRHKQQACEAVGIRSSAHKHPTSMTQTALLSLIKSLNADESVHGILVQLPLPEHIDSSTIIEAIAPDKDVDGFHPYNIGRLALREPALRPCTPKGIIRLLTEYNIEIKGTRAVIVGASNIVGRPMALELLHAGSTVTICHKFTRDLQSEVERADLLVVAAGKPGLIPGEWIKPGAIVVDVGINRQEGGKIVGDVDYDVAKSRAGWISPVPGGVGPMTVAMLLENTFLAAGFSYESDNSAATSES